VQHALDALIARQSHPDEAALLRRLPDLLEQLDASAARERLEWCGPHLARAALDLVRFTESSEPLSSEELDEYTFLVAGAWANSGRGCARSR